MPRRGRVQYRFLLPLRPRFCRAVACLTVQFSRAAVLPAACPSLLRTLYVIRASVWISRVRRPLASPSNFKRLVSFLNLRKSTKISFAGTRKTDEIPLNVAPAMGKRRPDRLRRCRALCGNRRDLSALSHPGQRQGDKRAAGLHVLQRSDVEVPRTLAAELRQYQSRSGRIRSLQKLCERTLCSRSTRAFTIHPNGETVSTKISSITRAIFARIQLRNLINVFSENAPALEWCEKSLPESGEEVAPTPPQLSVA